MTALLFAALIAQAQPAQQMPAARQERAVEYSDAYYTRLTIHRYGSYAMLPLFAFQYYLGDRLLNDTALPEWVNPAHTANAIAIGTLFTTNTVTGVWNLIESRHERDRRGRRFLHAGLMIAADAGFVYTGTLAGDATRTQDGRDRHRSAALTSMGLSAAGAALMWFFQDE